jgi:hypothetical protein
VVQQGRNHPHLYSTYREPRRADMNLFIVINQSTRLVGFIFMLASSPRPNNLEVMIRPLMSLCTCPVPTDRGNTFTQHSVALNQADDLTKLNDQRMCPQSTRSSDGDRCQPLTTSLNYPNYPTQDRLPRL